LAPHVQFQTDQIQGQLCDDLTFRSKAPESQDVSGLLGQVPLMHVSTFPTPDAHCEPQMAEVMPGEKLRGGSKPHRVGRHRAWELVALWHTRALSAGARPPHQTRIVFPTRGGAR
jgi:hypothetical protein